MEAEDSETMSGKSEDAEEQKGSVLPLGAPAKLFYEHMFENHEKITDRKDGGRNVMKVYGTCKTCAKRIAGTDSYFLFKEHYQKAHATPVELVVADTAKAEVELEIPGKELVAELMDIPPMDAEELPPSSSEKEFFQLMYSDHEAAPGMRRNGDPMYKFSAVCKKCSKRVVGMGSPAAFKAHFRKQHGLGHEDGAKVRMKSVGYLAEDGQWNAKYFYDHKFANHEVFKEGKEFSVNQRECSRFVGTCRLCEKKVTGTDSYFNFRQHYKRAHPEEKMHPDIGDEIDLKPAVRRVTRKRGIPGFEDVPIDDIPAKAFYEQLYADQSFKKSEPKDGDKKGGERRRYNASCIQCGKIVGGTATFHNFKHHYLTFHRDFFAATEEPFKKRHKAAAAGENLKALTEQERKNLERNVVMCVVESLMPVTAFSGNAFAKLLTDLGIVTQASLGGNLVSRLLPKIRKDIVERITDECRKMTSVSLTVISSTDTVLVYARGIDEKWKLRNPCLYILKLGDGGKDGDQLLKAVTSAITEYAISDKIVHIRDNLRLRNKHQKGAAERDSSVFPASGAEEEPADSGSELTIKEEKPSSPFKYRARFTEQIKIDESSFQIDHIASSLDACLATMTDHSPLLSSALDRLRQQYVTLSWELHQRPPSTSSYDRDFGMLNDRSWMVTSPTDLTSDEQKLVDQYAKILSSFEECFAKLDEREEPTLCDVLPFVYGLRRWLEAHINESGDEDGFASRVLDKMAEVFQPINTDPTCVAATCLDPKYKLVWVKGSKVEEDADKIKQIILDQLIQKDPKFRAKPAKKASLLSFVETGGQSVNAEVSENQAAREELEAYLNDKEIGRSTLEYWKVHGKKYKRLASLARSLLCLSATMTEEFVIDELQEKDRYLTQHGVDPTELLFCHLNRQYML